MDRSPRLTELELDGYEALQTEVIVRLAESGHDDLAFRLSRCQHDRQHRQPNVYPWRCRSAGCWACRRTLMRRWWKALRDWLPSGNLSLVTIALDDDLIIGVRRLRKALRDVRDRGALYDTRWAAVTMAGMFSGDHLLLLIHHAGIERKTLTGALRNRWPDVVVTSADRSYPSWQMDVDDVVRLGLSRRGVAPLRVVIPAQRIASQAKADWDQPMPMLF